MITVQLKNCFLHFQRQTKNKFSLQYKCIFTRKKGINLYNHVIEWYNMLSVLLYTFKLAPISQNFQIKAMQTK